MAAHILYTEKRVCYTIKIQINNLHLFYATGELPVYSAQQNAVTEMIVGTVILL